MPRSAARSSGRPSAAFDATVGAVADVRLAVGEDVQRDGAEVHRLVGTTAGHRGDDHLDPGDGPAVPAIPLAPPLERQRQRVAAGRHVVDPERPVGTDEDRVFPLTILEIGAALGRPEERVQPGLFLLLGEVGVVVRGRRQDAAGRQVAAVREEEVGQPGPLRQGEPADDRPARPTDLDLDRLAGPDIDVDRVRRRPAVVVRVVDPAIDGHPARRHAPRTNRPELSAMAS